MSTTRRELLGAAGVGALSMGVAPFEASSKEAPTSSRLTTASRTEPSEPILEPELPIIDPHHHLWFVPESRIAQLLTPDSIFARDLAPMFHRHPRYLLDEFLADANTGHNLLATVYLEAGAMYRDSGPEAMKSVGEVEFANGVAAMAASGLFGKVKVCAGIVGNADLTLGDAVQDVLEAHIRAGGGRYRGVRGGPAYDPDSRILGPGGTPHILLDKTFRAGFRRLHKLGLSFDVLLLGPQLPDLTDLARSFPETQIILNHVGEPVGVASYAGKRDEWFPRWVADMRTLAKCDNVVVKLGGLGSTSLQGFKTFLATPQASSEQLAAEWKPYIETCVEAFGANRCMFESDYPPGSSSCTYPVLWNAFKRLATGASKEEKAALFSETAKHVYRLDI